MSIKDDLEPDDLGQGPDQVELELEAAIEIELLRCGLDPVERDSND